MARKRTLLTQSSDDYELAHWVDGICENSMYAMQREQSRWYRNIAFLGGQQWIRWNKRLSTVDELPRTKDWHVRLTLNLLRDVIHRMVSAVTRGDPRFFGVPQSATEGDRLSARAVGRYLDHVWESNYLSGLLEDEVLIWAMTTGRGWVQPYWDPDAGDVNHVRVPKQTTPEDEAGPEGKEDLFEAIPGLAEEAGASLDPGFKTVAVREGAIRFRCVSPFNVVFDLSGESYAEARYAGTMTFANRQNVEENFNLKPGTLTPDTQDAQRTGFSQSVREGMQTIGRGIGSMMAGSVAGSGTNGKYLRHVGLYDSPSDTSELVMLKEIYFQPNEKYPDGRYVAVCNGLVLNKGRGEERFYNPYGGINLISFEAYPRVGSPFCDAPMDDLCPPQMAVNRLVSNHIAVGNLTRGRQWLVHNKSLVDRNSFTDAPNQIILYGGRPGLTVAPKPVDPPRYTGEMAAELNIYIEMIERISGVREVSQGENVSGGRSAAVVRHLATLGEQGRKSIQNRYRRSIAKLGRLVVLIAQRFVKEDRLIPMTGKNGQLSAQLFRSADIESCLDVRVVCEDGPNSVMEKKQYALDLANVGLFDMQDPQQKTVFMRLLDHPDLDALIDMDETSERTRVYEENMMMLNGEEVRPEPFDNQLLHAMGVTAFMKEARTRELMESDPQLKQRLLAHRDAHIMALQGSEAAEAPIDESSSAPGGSSGGAGSPGGPAPTGPGGGAMPTPGVTSEVAL